MAAEFGKIEDTKGALKRLFSQTQIVKDWQKGNWQAMSDWLGDFDIGRLTSSDERGELHQLVTLDCNDQV